MDWKTTDFFLISSQFKVPSQGKILFFIGYVKVHIMNFFLLILVVATYRKETAINIRNKQVRNF